MGIARPRRQAPKAQARLSAFAANFAQDERDLDEVAEGLRDDRDKAIKKAYRDGMTMEAIAKTLRMSHQRVSQIVRS
jgi:DNA-directed RNA polymerase specialized sigma subunit